MSDEDGRRGGVMDAEPGPRQALHLHCPYCGALVEASWCNDGTAEMYCARPECGAWWDEEGSPTRVSDWPEDDHKCQPEGNPAELPSATVWTCPVDRKQWISVKRMIGRKMYGEWRERLPIRTR